MPISEATKQIIRERANYLCEYCHSPERLSANRFTIDRIIPKSLGGSDEIDNLALACRRCNERRYNFTTGVDPETGEEVPLFNPRQQIWSEHFIWSVDALKIMGITPSGRATCNRLDLNDERRKEPFIQNARQQWIAAQLHPPTDDPRQ